MVGPLELEARGQTGLFAKFADPALGDGMRSRLKGLRRALGSMGAVVALSALFLAIPIAVLVMWPFHVKYYRLRPEGSRCEGCPFMLLCEPEPEYEEL